MNTGGINYSPDFGATRGSGGPSPVSVVQVAASSGIPLDKLQVIHKRDVDAAISTSKQLAEVVVKLSRRIEDLAEKLAQTKQQLAELVALHHSSLKQRDEEIAERIAKLESRLNNRH